MSSLGVSLLSRSKIARGLIYLLIKMYQLVGSGRIVKSSGCQAILKYCDLRVSMSLLIFESRTLA